MELFLKVLYRTIQWELYNSEFQLKRRYPQEAGRMDRWVDSALSASDGARRFRQLLVFMPNAPSPFFRFAIFSCNWHSKCSHFRRLLFSVRHLLWNVGQRWCGWRVIQYPPFSTSLRWGTKMLHMAHSPFPPLPLYIWKATGLWFAWSLASVK